MFCFSLSPFLLFLLYCCLHLSLFARLCSLLLLVPSCRLSIHCLLVYQSYRRNRIVIKCPFSTVLHKSPLPFSFSSFPLFSTSPILSLFLCVYPSITNVSYLFLFFPFGEYLYIVDLSLLTKKKFFFFIHFSSLYTHLAWLFIFFFCFFDFNCRSLLT